MQIDGDILELHMQQSAHSNTSARTLTVCTMYKNLVLHIKFTWSITQQRETWWQRVNNVLTVLNPELCRNRMMASPISPFRSRKSKSDDKHDLEVYVEYLIHDCVMQNVTTQRRKLKRGNELNWAKPWLVLEHRSVSRCRIDIQRKVGADGRESTLYVMAALRKFYDAGRKISWPYSRGKRTYCPLGN